jgi:hypothetical protein
MSFIQSREHLNNRPVAQKYDKIEIKYNYNTTVTSNHQLTTTTKMEQAKILETLIIRKSILLWRKNPTIKSWDAIFNKNHTPVLLLYNTIYNNKNISLASQQQLDDYMNSATQFYEKETFQSYIESKLQGSSKNNRTQYNQDMQDPVFKNNLYAKYQKNEQLKSIKNRIIQEMLKYTINRVPNLPI